MGFQRGGTNVLMNLLSSHPRTQRTGNEFHEVFFGRADRRRAKWVVRAFAAPVLLAATPSSLWPYRFHDRRALPRWARTYARAMLFVNRWSNYKATDRPAGSRSLAERASARAVIKAVNGLAFATPIFDGLYPQCYYVFLVRDPFALGHGFIRRGWTAERFARMYRDVGQRFLDEERQRSDARIVRFEDLLEQPIETTRHLWRFLGLDPDVATTFKLQAKMTTRPDGTRTLPFGSREREIVWFEPGEVGSYLKADVNRSQLSQLGEHDAACIASIAGSVAKRLGYAFA